MLLGFATVASGTSTGLAPMFSYSPIEVRLGTIALLVSACRCDMTIRLAVATAFYRKPIPSFVSFSTIHCEPQTQVRRIEIFVADAEERLDFPHYIPNRDESADSNNGGRTEREAVESTLDLSRWG